MKSSRLRIFAALVVGLFSVSQLAAQATLSVQGVLQKTTGMAVEDGDYAITFRLYTTESGGTAVWSETQSDVEVVGGVYGVQLGSVNPLNIPFDQVYYLGLTVSGGAEHFPRTKLTAAPYALSLLGQDNTFPSTGNVGIGTTTPTAKLEVLGSLSTNALSTEESITTATSVAVSADDHVIYLDHTANQNITLPAAAASEGRHLVLVNKAAVAKTLTSSNYVDVTTGATSTTVPANSVIELQSDGSVWRQTGGYVKPVAQAKAYVLASAVQGSTTYSFVVGGTTIQFTESQDAQNCFASNTFTAPRTGYYRLTCQLFGSYNGTASSTGSIQIMCGGTCAFGVENRILHLTLHPYLASTGGFGVPTFSADVYMTAGQTLFLKVQSSLANSIYFYAGSTCYLSILEQ